MLLECADRGAQGPDVFPGVGVSDHEEGEETEDRHLKQNHPHIHVRTLQNLKSWKMPQCSGCCGSASRSLGPRRRRSRSCSPRGGTTMSSQAHRRIFQQHLQRGLRLGQLRNRGRARGDDRQRARPRTTACPGELLTTIATVTGRRNRAKRGSAARQATKQSRNHDTFSLPQTGSGSPGAFSHDRCGD